MPVIKENDGKIFRMIKGSSFRPKKKSNQDPSPFDAYHFNTPDSKVSDVSPNSYAKYFYLSQNKYALINKIYKY